MVKGKIKKVWLIVAVIFVGVAAIFNFATPYGFAGAAYAQELGTDTHNGFLEINSNEISYSDTTDTDSKAAEAETIQSPGKPQIEVPVDLAVEENDQKSVDAGHSPWKLDPVFVAQVFVSLKISPEGITGDYPIKTEELKIIEDKGNEIIIEVTNKQSPVKRVYLKRLIKQDPTGIWTVVGYDPAD